MQKRLGDLLEAFEHCRFEQCLRMSDQILKKIEKEKDGKKKQAMSQLDMQNLYMTRVGSLATTGNIHEANELIKQKFKEPIISPQSSFLFLQICTLAMDRRLPDFVATINDKKQKKQIDINRFIFLTHKFSVLSRIFLRKFANEKNNKDSIGQIYLQYLQQLDQQKMIKYERDRTIKQNKNLNFKFVSMFLQKFISTFKAIQMPNDRIKIGYHLKTQRAIADLRFKISIHEGNSATVRKLFNECQKDITENIFMYLRSLKALQNQKQINEVVWRQQFLRIFRNNLNLDTYQPIYDFSIEFIKQFVKQVGTNLTQIADPIKISNQQLYAFKQNKKQQLENYLSSLFSQFTELKQKQKENKKKDFYKIALKNCLLLLIYTLNLTNKIALVQKFLLDYKEQYSKKLTFPEQILPYSNNEALFAKEFTQLFKQPPLKLQNDEDKLIWVINYERMFATNPLKNTLEQNMKEWQRLHNLYQTNARDIEKLKKLQKGERYLSDQFLTIEADSIRKFTEEASNDRLNQTQRQQLYFYILGQLEEAINKSPHNHDNKLRAIYFYNKLNYYQDVLKTLESMDIKAVQFETLGYFYLKNFINFCMWDSNQQLLVKMIRSYQENYRESTQYAYKAVASTSFNECEENLCYGEHIDRSYNLLVLLYIFYMKNRGKPNAEFYLKQILQRIKQNNGRITFNCDFKVIRNYIDPNGPSFADFYGIFNNYQTLQNECKIKLLLRQLVNEGMSEQQIGQMRKSIKYIENASEVYNFSQYVLFDRVIEYKYNGEHHYEKITQDQLRIWNRINKITLSIADFILNIRKEGNLREEQLQKIKKGITELAQQLSNLSWRNQILCLPSARYHVSEIIPVLVYQVELYSAKKKKVEGQAQKKQACQQLINLLLQSVSDRIKIQQRLAVDKKYMKPEFLHRDDLLERVTKINPSEYKKLYKIKL